jgi:hypothetical protein
MARLPDGLTKKRDGGAHSVVASLVRDVTEQPVHCQLCDDLGKHRRKRVPLRFLVGCCWSIRAPACLTARRVRVQVGSGFVDLAAQFAPFVRRQAAAAPAGALILLLRLAPLFLGPLFRDARIELALFGPRRLLLGRGRAAFETRLFALLRRVGRAVAVALRAG